MTDSLDWSHGIQPTIYFITLLMTDKDNTDERKANASTLHIVIKPQWTPQLLR